MSDPVQLPAIGGGAAAVTTANASALLSEGMSIGGPERFPAGVGQENPYMKAGTQPTLRIASHRGVLESQGHNRGRGDRREKQSREKSRERSRRCDRTNKEDPRRGGSSTVGVAETEYKKPKLEHDRKSDELMDAQGPPVFDLTQQDDDDENDTTVPPREKEKMAPDWDRTSTLTSINLMKASRHPHQPSGPRPLLHSLTLSNNNNRHQSHHRGLVTSLTLWQHCTGSKTAHTLTCWI